MLLNELKQYKPYSLAPGYQAEHILYGENTEQQLIEGTSYFATNNQKVLKGIVHSDIDKDEVYVLLHTQSLLFSLSHQHETGVYLEYFIHEHRFMLAATDQASDERLYRLLLTTINYLYNHYQIEEFKPIYEAWRHINMAKHLHGDNWDADDHQNVMTLGDQLMALVQSILSHPNGYLALYYDSVAEVMEQKRLSFAALSLVPLFLFQQDPEHLLLDLEEEKTHYASYHPTDYDLPDVCELYPQEEKAKLPLFLQESIQANERLYLQNRAFLDRSDIELIRSFKRGKTWSCLYYGPSGTGKTTKLLCIAGALGLPSLKMVGSRAIDESSLFGKYVLRNGETVFEYGPLSLMMKYGGMFIFDEINMVDSDIISSLNDVLDGTKQKILDNGEIITAHPLFRFGESMNIGYAGTNEMNLSHKSRIQNKIKISQLSIEKMTQIIVKETGLDEKYANQMAEMLEGFNEIILNEGNETTQRIDLRTLLNWANKTVDLEGDIIRASLVTIISELAEEDDEILNLEDPRQIMATNGAASTVMRQIVSTFLTEDKDANT